VAGVGVVDGTPTVSELAVGSIGDPSAGGVELNPTALAGASLASAPVLGPGVPVTPATAPSGGTGFVARPTDIPITAHAPTKAAALAPSANRRRDRARSAALARRAWRAARSATGVGEGVRTYRPGVPDTTLRVGRRRSGPGDSGTPGDVALGAVPPLGLLASPPRGRRRGVCPASPPPPVAACAASSPSVATSRPVRRRSSHIPIDWSTTRGRTIRPASSLGRKRTTLAPIPRRARVPTTSSTAGAGS
jgi:hypothetical protein